MYKWRKLAVMLAFAVILGICAGGCQMGGKEVVLSQKLGNEDVFRIGDRVCTLAEAKVFLTNYQNIYGTAYDVNLWQHDFGENSLEQYVKDVCIAQLAQIVAMNQLAKEREITLTEEEEQQVKLAAAAYYETLNEAEIAYMGVDEECIEELYRQYGLANKLYRELSAGVSSEVSDDEARVMEAMQIFVTDESTADVVESRLKDGSDFAAVANTYNKAEQMEVNFARGNMSKELEAVVFDLQPDQISDKIETEKGFYFVKCINNYNQELTDENKQVILKHRRKEAFEDIYKQYISELPSEINQGLWDSIKIEVNQEILTKSFFEVFEEYCQW